MSEPEKPKPKSSWLDLPGGIRIGLVGIECGAIDGADTTKRRLVIAWSEIGELHIETFVPRQWRLVVVPAAGSRAMGGSSLCIATYDTPEEAHRVFARVRNAWSRRTELALLRPIGGAS